MKIGGHFQNHGSCCVLLAWPVEVIDEFFKYLGPATTFMCVLCQGLSTVDALGISVGCHVAMIDHASGHQSFGLSGAHHSGLPPPYRAPGGPSSLRTPDSPVLCSHPLARLRPPGARAPKSRRSPKPGPLAVEPRCPSLELPPLVARRESLTKEMRWIFFLPN